MFKSKKNFFEEKNERGLGKIALTWEKVWFSRKTAGSGRRGGRKIVKNLPRICRVNVKNGSWEV